ncbi:MAG: alpha/beta hydrolase [Verrucomicrobiota bacterium]
MNLKPIIGPLTIAAACMMAACSPYASVAEKRPYFRPVRSAVGALVSVEREIADAMRREKSAPLVAIGEYLNAAKTASRQLAFDPNDAHARDAYNFAVARVFGTIKQANLDPWTRPLNVPETGGGFTLTYKPDPRKAWNPGLYDFTPADQVDIKGSYVSQHTVKPGVGAPLVAVGRGMNQEAKTEFGIPKIYYGVTAVIRFEGSRAVVALEDPLADESVVIGDRSFPLAADYTASIAVMLANNDPKKLELARLLQPEKYAETAHIARLQPYDPNKTVVLVIHGLMDSPATWVPMLNALRGDERIRKNYQFWFYSYPSGYPYPYSASILRSELDAIQKRFPLRKKMVVLGHSMGGCISRLLITDTSDEKLWLKLVHKPPGEVQMSRESRKLFTEALIFRSRPEIGRVVFIAAPLKGSDLASGWMGRLGSRLVRAPATLLAAGTDALKLATFQGDDLRLKQIPNSVDTLAPNNRFVRAIQTVPVAPGIPCHVICGDRGKGGNHDKTSPVRSDGVVPYWSSHMDGASSELIVPSNHSAHQNPQAIGEVKRILELHSRGHWNESRRNSP